MFSGHGLAVRLDLDEFASGGFQKRVFDAPLSTGTEVSAEVGT